MAKRMTVPSTEADWICGACACLGIRDLGMEKDAISAMQRFCELQLVLHATKYGKSSYNTLESFFIFIAGPEVPGHFHSKKWVRYGTEFAEFIETNKLGKVVSPGKAPNAKHHRGVDCQTWVWMPDRAALIAWWEQNKPEPIPAATGEVPVVSGFWNRALGIAGLEEFACPHCDHIHLHGDNVWQGSDDKWYCKAVGKASGG